MNILLKFSFSAVILLSWVIEVFGSSCMGKKGDLLNAPLGLEINGKKLSAIDIERNKTSWKLSEDLKTIEGKTLLYFTQKNQGRPYLLLNPNSRVWIEGDEVKIQKIESLEGNYYFLNKPLQPCTDYKIEVTFTFKSNFKNHKNFLPLEYSRHSYIEMGIPANGMYDRFKTELEISFKREHKLRLFSNADSIRKENNQYNITFPDHFTSMSYFIDLLPEEDLFGLVSKKLKSIDGRLIPMQVYSTKDDTAKGLVPTFSHITEYTFHELEKKYGPYPHNQLIFKVSNKARGNGSYAGAMALSSFYVEHITHELGHHWFLQSLTPKNGGDIWFYEGLGFWMPYLGIMKGFTQVAPLEQKFHLNNAENTLWSNNKVIPISQLQAPHQAGSFIIAAIDQHIKSKGQGDIAKGGLNLVLKKIAQENKHSTVDTVALKGLLEKHTQLNFDNIFNFYFVF